MKFKIKYSYEKDTGYSARHKATAYDGWCKLTTSWDYSFSVARANIIQWLMDYKHRLDASRAIKLEQKLNPPPPTEIIEI